MDTDTPSPEPEEHTCAWEVRFGFGDKKGYSCTYTWSDGVPCGYLTMDPSDRVEVKRYPKSSAQIDS